jgi:hypothetical protein
MKRNNDFIMQTIGGEALLVPLGARVMDMNGLVTLNGTAACVWELLAAECSLDELAAALEERFDVDLDTAKSDVQTFTDEIAKIGLLEP